MQEARRFFLHSLEILMLDTGKIHAIEFMMMFFDYRLPIKERKTHPRPSILNPRFALPNHEKQG